MFGLQEGMQRIYYDFLSAYAEGNWTSLASVSCFPLIQKVYSGLNMTGSNSLRGFSENNPTNGKINKPHSLLRTYIPIQIDR